MVSSVPVQGGSGDRRAAARTCRSVRLTGCSASGNPELFAPREQGALSGIIGL